ncbi:MAG: FAD-binding protein, partial [Gemmatimonadota bacterium]
MFERSHRDRPGPPRARDRASWLAMVASVLRLAATLKETRRVFQNSPKSQTEYDVIIVGSGAGGGMAAYQLGVAGLKVLVLEAGRHYDPQTETAMFNLPREAPLRAAGSKEKPFGFYDATVDGGWEVPGEPYTTAPGSKFAWWRSRMLGGRTNHWGRISLRMG